MTVRLSFRVAAAAFTAVAIFAAPASAAPGDRLQDAPISVTPISAEQLEANRSTADGVLTSLNGLRADPAGYAAGLRGNSAETQQAAAFLRGISVPPPPLIMDDRLNAAAIEQVRYLGETNLLTHAGYGGSTPGARIRLRGFNSTLTAEELSFGQQQPADVIRQLVLDAGVTGAPHRRDLLNPVFTYAGAACGPHRGQRRVCVIVLSNNPFGETTSVAAADAPQVQDPVDAYTPAGVQVEYGGLAGGATSVPTPDPVDSIIDYDFGGIDNHMAGWRPDLRGPGIVPLSSDPIWTLPPQRVDGIARGAFDGWLLHDLEFGGEDGIPAAAPPEPELSPEPGFPARDSAYEPATDATPPQEPVIDPSTPM